MREGAILAGCWLPRDDPRLWELSLLMGLGEGDGGHSLTNPCRAPLQKPTEAGGSQTCSRPQILAVGAAEERRPRGLGLPSCPLSAPSGQPRAGSRWAALQWRWLTRLKGPVSPRGSKP